MNPADICRECELTSKARELEEQNRALKMVGDRLVMALSHAIIGMGDKEPAYMEAVEAWLKAKEESE